MNLCQFFSILTHCAFVTFTNNMNQFNYLEILAKYFLPFAISRFGDNFILHQDNDPKHTSHICRDFLENNSVLWAKAPAQSPDLNPSELVWADMKKFVSTKLCKNLDEVQLAIDEYRFGLTPQKCQKCISHLQKVIPVVIEREGGWSNM